MSLQIGRIPAIAEPMDWKNVGDQVTITGRLAAGSAGAAIALRDQLLGYDVNPDEPVIPIISGADARLTGYYRPLSVAVPTTPAMMVSNGVLDYVIHAQRITAFKAAVIESILTGTLMVNGLGIATATVIPSHGFPNKTYEYQNSGLGPNNPLTRPVADGSVIVNWAPMDNAGSPVFKALPRFSLAPADFYGGACSIYNLLPADHVVIGRQDAPFNTYATGWRMSNGLVQIQIDSFVQSGGYGDFRVDWADASNAYRTSTAFGFSSATAGLFLCPTPQLAAVKIIRNSPEECIIRLPIQAATGWPVGPITVDVSIRRGSRIIRFFVIATTAGPFGGIGDITFRMMTGRAATALTGGTIWTAADGFNNKVIFCSSQVVTKDLVNDQLTGIGASARLAFDVGASMEVNGGGVTYGDAGQSQIYQYLAPQVERMQVVGR